MVRSKFTAIPSVASRVWQTLRDPDECLRLKEACERQRQECDELKQEYDQLRQEYGHRQTQQQQHIQSLRASVQGLEEELALFHRYYPLLRGAPVTPAAHSMDGATTAWRHPYLTEANLRRFRQYSEQVWDFAFEYARQHPKPPNIAFAVNMAQTMYKWAVLAQERGANATLFLHPWDRFAFSLPEWEEFDGEFSQVHDGDAFLRQFPEIESRVPCRTVPIEDDGLAQAYIRFVRGERADFYRYLAAHPGLRPEPFVDHGASFLAYAPWACELTKFDVILAASIPIAAYLSGRPYCTFSVGGDLQIDCGRGDFYGQVMGLAFAASRFLFISNPFALSGCRRLGFVNALYMPYTMDDRRYCPGEGRARQQWQQRYGGEVYALATARIDNAVKGNGHSLLDVLGEVARERPEVRFIFLAWGEHAESARAEVAARGFTKQFIFLPPVGKERLRDYYRSCDLVIDQFLIGYYGATALEAASIGKPVVMMIRDNHYRPLYAGDIAPVENAADPPSIRESLLRLIDRPDYRREKGRLMRDWLVRTHGEDRTMPRMLAILRMVADRAPLPHDLVSPLLDPLHADEMEYHRHCVQAE